MNQFRTSVMFSLKTLLVIGVVTVFYIVRQVYYPSTIYFNKGNYVFIFGYIVMLLLFMQIYGGFKFGKCRVGELIYSSALSIMITNFFIYLQISLISNRLVEFVPIVTMMSLQLCIVGIISWTSHRVYFKLYPPTKVVALCSGTESELQIIQKMSKLYRSYIIEDVLIHLPAENQLLQSIDRVEAVFIGDIDERIKRTVIQHCYEQDKIVYLLPTIGDMFIYTAQNMQIYDKALLKVESKKMVIEQKLIKRALDIVIATIGLILASPLMLLTAMLIKLEDGGAIFYKQERVTKDERRFMLYKFRSMVQGAEEDGIPRLATQDDIRITKVGKVIRMVRIDELPQLINVLKGDMSIVGPRPERPELLEQYKAIYPDMIYRTKIKAGLTGFAQVKGKYNTSPQDKLFFDLYYIQNYSILLDIKIMILTLKILFMPSSTEGIQLTQRTEFRINDMF